MPLVSARQKRLASALGLAAVTMMAALTSGWWSGTLIHSDIAPGTTLDGRLPEAALELEDWLGQQQSLMEQTEVPLLAQRETLGLKARDLGISLDVVGTVEGAKRGFQDASLVRRIALLAKAWQGKLDLPIVFSFDDTTAKEALQRLAPWIRREPVDARLDLGTHQRIRAVLGSRLDIESTLRWLKEHYRDQPLVVRLVERPIAPEVTDEMLSAVDVTRVLSRYETSFSGRAGPRAVNIHLAAQALDGWVLLPNQVFSFDHTVGTRSTRRGYREAPVIVNDELEPGVGGGVCQVATTVHAAAVYGGLEVVARRSHSRPSGYASLGLDATVIEGEVDLKLRNPYQVPLMIHTSFPGPYRLRVEWLGRDPPAVIEHLAVIKKREPYYRRLITHPELRPGTSERKQKGISGYEVVSVVRARYPDGHVTTHRYRSKYWPVPEVYWVSPGVSPVSLPRMPEEASHVEWDGREIEATQASTPPNERDGHDGLDEPTSESKR